MFRKLYWVIERVDDCGCGHVIGVFTSIPNLIKEGLGSNHRSSLRLTLTKLDEENGSVGTWMGPKFDGLPCQLDELAKTEVFSAEHCEALVSALS